MDIKTLLLSPGSWLALGTAAVIGVWWARMNPTTSNVTLVVGILALSIAVWLLPWDSALGLPIRFAASLAVAVAFGITARLFKLWAPSSEPETVQQVRVKYSLHQIVQSVDFTVTNMGSVPTNLQSTLNLGGVASLRVFMGGRNFVAMAKNPTYFEPKPKAPSKGVEIAGLVISSEFKPEIRFDLDKNQTNIVEIDGRRFRVKLFSISPKPFGENAGIVEYEFGVDEE